MQWIGMTAVVCRYWLRNLQSADVVLNVYKRALRHVLSVMWCNMHYCQHNCQYSGKNIFRIRPWRLGTTVTFLGWGCGFIISRLGYQHSFSCEISGSHSLDHENQVFCDVTLDVKDEDTTVLL